ncbi:MAG: DUF5916 domain-containing protein [Gemmatimonadaceae bacterium]
MPLSTTFGVSRIFLATAALLALAPAANAQRVDVTPSRQVEPREGRAAAVRAAPAIDGHLSEEIWASGDLYEGFTQRELREGDPVTERTEVRILTDGEALYIGAWLFDREPGGIMRGDKVRDVTLTNSDYFGIILDTYFDRQNGFVFATTPSGIEHDGQVVKEGEGGGVFQQGQGRAQAGSMGGFNLNWDASWTVATSVDSLGWYAEFRIPFATLRYGGGGDQTWGLNLVRGIRRKNEEAFWSFIPRQFNLMRLSLAGTLRGVQVPVRRVATATPYVLGGTARNYMLQNSEFDATGEWGADLKYGLTPSLTLDLTYNTDFAQVEVDEQRTNLTRFPLFFPEKRPFFLENAGVFSAGTPQAIELFFTRRIGIDSLGSPVPILGGGRITGRAGGTTVGLLHIYTDEVAGRQSSTAYTVGRASRELGRRSRVGVIGVQRETAGPDNHNRTIGLDGRLGLSDAWTFDWWGAKTETPGQSGDDFGFSARAGYQTQNWTNAVRYIRVGEDFNPAVGFLNRGGGFRFYEVALMRLVRNERLKWLRQWNPHINYRGYFDLDGHQQSGQIHVDFTEVEFADGGRFGPEFNYYVEGLRDTFNIARGVKLPPGDYSWPTLSWDFTTNPSAPLSIAGRSDMGPFYNGTRLGGNATLTWRRGASLSTSLVGDYQDVELDQGSFIRSRIGFRLAYFFTPRVFLQSLTQYNDQDRIWNANVRFGWLNTAGTGLFIVFNDGREADAFFDWVRPQTRSFIVKYTHQFGTRG